MKKIRAAVVGYGNIGHFALEALEAAPDFEVAGVVRRDPSKRESIPTDIPVVADIRELNDVDVAILATPTRKVEEYAREILALGINTVDSFDIHSQIPQLHRSLGKVAEENGKVAVISAGWDPGSDSVVRTLLEAIAPKGLTYTNFGPRMVYVELLPGYELEKVAAAIKADPYFASDETHVFEVESVDDVKDMGHGVNLVRKGVSGKTQNQLFEFDMKINNPALTGQVLVCVARAAMRQRPGCYTMIEIPVIDLLPGDRDRWIRRLV